ncbi:MAG: hypothetical protein M3306_15900 [Actinomycetota bacterium]|nr:hypothetical protein [Actinomycetota bacterium]
MSTITTAQQTTRSTRAAARKAVWLHGLGATVVASAVVTIVIPVLARRLAQ